MSKKSKGESSRIRRFFFICYPESLPKPIDVCIREALPDKYAYILHDEDYDINEQLKKEHYHVYLDFENARTYSSIAKQFGIAENNVEYCKSPKYAVRYMLHRDNPEKTAYYPDSIHSKNVPVEDYLKDNDEDSNALCIIARAKSHEDRTFGDFVTWIVLNGFYSTFRRSSSTYKEIYYNG